MAKLFPYFLMSVQYNRHMHIVSLPKGHANEESKSLLERIYIYNVFTVGREIIW